MKTYTFRAIIEPDDPGGYHGFVPILKGLHTCGETIEETKENLKDAIKCHVVGLLKAGETIPREEESLEIIQTFSEQELKGNLAYA
ncbi:type II toxin-antitoxin system HicB family antitoxin [Candidatus Shapirobacteria bacterium]|nr:type II toxin-antitoxin system HicB family antitoxin [Candidatus Shapirobacteria bacterium]